MINRLRWVMLGVMLFSMVATLAGQPPDFWRHPQSAMRFDGLSIYNHTNAKFEFLLGHGWAPYVIACLAYFTAAFALVSALPKKLGLTAIFAFIFGHFYGGSSWLATRWHAGFGGLTVYALTLAAALAFAITPVVKDGRLVLMRLRWIAVAALLMDFTNTLIGQPHSYWQNPAAVYEGNALSRYFLLHGWWAFCMYDMAYCVVILWLAASLPRNGAFMSTFAFLLGGYAGASNWFFYVWRMGIAAPILYGTVLSAIMVALVFSDSREASGFGSPFPRAATSSGGG